MIGGSSLCRYIRLAIDLGKTFHLVALGAAGKVLLKKKFPKAIRRE